MSSRTYHPDRGATNAERKARFDAKRRAERITSFERIGAKPPRDRREADNYAALQFDESGRSWRYDEEDIGERPRRVGIVAQRQRESFHADLIGEPLTAWERQFLGWDDKQRSRRPAKPRKIKPIFERKTKTEVVDYSPEANLEWALKFMRDYEAKRRQ